VDPRAQFSQMLDRPAPVLALAPMQGVANWAFWKLAASYGGADGYFTEYFRAHSNSHLSKRVLKPITENPTGKPVVAQILGRDIGPLVRAARELQQYPIVAVDLNLGCPAPVVCRKGVGGGLLREPERLDAILGALREAVTIKLSVKTRLGFDSPAGFEQLLALFARHSVDLLTVHVRTVQEMYGGEVRYDWAKRAVEAMRCPVLANGDVFSAEKAAAVLRQTGARGLMIGRGAIYNPWIFEQIRQQQRGDPVWVPRGREVLAYLRALYEAMCLPAARERAQVERMKKFMNLFGVGEHVSPQFVHRIQRVETEAEFFRVCEEYLGHDQAMGSGA
jgi:tRNA-dihydrouridine synthase B